MKKIGLYGIYGVALIFVLALFFMGSGDKKEPSGESVKQTDASEKTFEEKAVIGEITEPAEKVEVFLFHSTNRCYSCVKAGELIQKTIDENFQKETAEGKLEFKEIDIDLSENKELAKKFQAAGTSIFINSILAGQDNIQEETKAWRLVSDEPAFIDHLKEKLEGLLGSQAKEVVAASQEEEKIILFYGETCPHCQKVEVYLEENSASQKLKYVQKEIYRNEENARLMREKAVECEMGDMSIGVPFLWADGKCLMGDVDVIEYFDQKINGIS